MTSGAEITEADTRLALEDQTTTPTRARAAFFGALLTALCLFGGMLLAFIVGISINNLPMHMPEKTMALLSSIPALIIMVFASVVWGESLGRLVVSPHKRRMRLAGGLSFTPMLLLASLALGQLERIIVERGEGPDLPVHVVFTILFVPAAGLVAAVCSFAQGLTHAGLRQGIVMGLLAGLAAGLGFLLVNLLMDALGYRVGAPGAAERFTMITVMLAGSLGAALAGGAALGAVLVIKPERG